MFIFRTQNECPEKRTFIHSNLIVLLAAIVVIDEFCLFIRSRENGGCDDSTRALERLLFHLDDPVDDVCVYSVQVNFCK